MLIETWENVIGYEGLYLVSSEGKIKSVARNLDITKEGKGGRRSVKERILKQGTSNCGYRTVTLCKNNTKETRTVHTIVLESFSGERPEGMVCRHFPDRDKSNNNASNLQWGTKSENQLDRKFHGTNYNGSKKEVSDTIVTLIRIDYGSPKCTQRFLAKKYNIGLSTINHIVNNKY